MNLNTTPITTGAWINVLPEPVYRSTVAVQRKPLAYADGEISQFLPPFDAKALSLARTIDEIDAITDKLVRDGLARDRADTSMLEVLRAQAARRYGGRK